MDWIVIDFICVLCLMFAPFFVIRKKDKRIVFKPAGFFIFWLFALSVSVGISNIGEWRITHDNDLLHHMIWDIFCCIVALVYLIWKRQIYISTL